MDTEVVPATTADEPHAPDAELPGPPPRAPVRRTLPILHLHPTRFDGPVPYLNRELSWLQFNERVLQLAEDPQTPLLERAKFLAIFQSNLDEFFQVRVAGLLEQRAAGVRGSNPDLLTPDEQLTAIRELVHELAARHAALFRDHLRHELAEHGIRATDWGELDADDRLALAEVFERRVFPVLTPLAVDPAHPFPSISSLSLNLAVLVREPATGATRFARVKIPPSLPRFVVLPDGERFVPIEQLVAAYLGRLFPGFEVVEHHVFRVTRNADFEVEEGAGDLLDAITSELLRRRFGRVVRLEVQPDMSDEVLDLLVHELQVDREAVIVLPGPLDLSGLMALHDLDRPDLKDPPFAPLTQARLATPAGGRVDLFEVLREGDILVHHPYDSFATSLQAFVEQAAHDPAVLAIKQTLYRTSGPGSPIIRALLDAADNGKQVVVLIELKARFDEEANIEWARMLEEAGIHVAYGVVGLKTHAKTCLVIRAEGDHIRRYAHIGTGNYNDKTARIYEDVGVFTTDDDIGHDLTDLYNVLTGYSRHTTYRKLLVAPGTLRDRMIELIEREAAEPDGHVVAKMNSLVDGPIIDALYAASQQDTPIDLIVRGICCLRPGVPGLSASIRVRSLVGRYLEHSRIWRFGSPRRGYDYLIGSGDWMPRNLDGRVEALAPVEDPPLQERLEEILATVLADDTLAWTLGVDSRWTKVPTSVGVNTHETLQQLATRRAVHAAEQA